MCCCVCCFLFQAEDGIRDLVRSRGLGDVYKRQARDVLERLPSLAVSLARRSRRLSRALAWSLEDDAREPAVLEQLWGCLLYTSDAADARFTGDLGGSRLI